MCLCSAKGGSFSVPANLMLPSSARKRWPMIALDRDAFSEGFFDSREHNGFLKRKVTGGPESKRGRALEARTKAGVPPGSLTLKRARDNMRLAVEKLGDADVQRESQPLNIVQRDTMLCILNVADLVLGELSGVRQPLLAQLSRKPQATHVLRQNASRCMNVPPRHLHGRPLDSKIGYGIFSIKRWRPETCGYRMHSIRRGFDSRAAPQGSGDQG